MSARSLALLAALLAGCAAPQPAAAPDSALARPLDTLPGGFDPALVRSDLLATARERFGAAAVERAQAAPAHLFAKRFAGMAPPPPPGAGPDWRPPTPAALLIREGAGWLAATPDGWRPAKPEAAAEIDALLADPTFWSEPAYTPPCPDYGANLLLLKAPGRAETLRNSLCDSRSARLVLAALSA